LLARPVQADVAHGDHEARMTSPRPGELGGEVPRRETDAEAQLGGADAVEKTTYVTGSGTSPEARRPPDDASAPVSARGHSPIVWVLLVFIILMAVAYGAGVFR
jgi:hypothetical protein